MWFPLAHCVAVAYGEGQGGLVEFLQDSELRQESFIVKVPDLKKTRDSGRTSIIP